MVAGGRKKVLEFTPSTSLLEVLKKMTEEKVTFSISASYGCAHRDKQIHRIAVVEKEGGIVTDILTQSDIIAFVVRHSYDGWFSEKADQVLSLSLSLSPWLSLSLSLPLPTLSSLSKVFLLPRSSHLPLLRSLWSFSAWPTRRTSALA